MRQPRSALRRAISLIAAVALVTTLVTAGIAPALALTVNRPAAAPAAAAVFAPPASTQFDIDGFLQTATLGGPGTGPGIGAHQGGQLTVNGQVVTVPSETIVIEPANALTWAELFTGAPAGYAPTQTGMALADLPLPPYTYEVHVVGNRVGDTYIAGLIDIAQVGLNSGAGYINDINYATGEFRVGGIIGSSTTGARVQLNDPLGRFGRVVSADPRFTVDADNPTVAAATGFPMCIPRTDPAGLAPDALCPESNRPSDGAGGFSISFQMADPSTQPGPDGILGTADDVPYLGGALDPRIQVPMEVGDYVNFAGTLINDAGGSFVSAHTVGNNAAIYTVRGTNPAYVATEVTLMGTGGLTVIGAGEAAIRTRFEGMTTDPSRRIHLYGIDVNPLTGATTDRDWGFIGVDQGPAGSPPGAVKGRWRFRPPCLAFGSIPTKPDKECVVGPDGIFLPPTREMRAVIEGQQTQVPGSGTELPSANGIFYGQYHAPILEYIFPENIPGTPIVPNNFEAFPFLACGGYTSAGGTLAAQLNPWPGAATPVCAAAPVASAGGPYTVGSGATVTLAGSATGSTPLTFAWTASAGTLSDASIANPVFTAPLVAADTPVNLSLTVTNSVGTSTSTAIVTVSTALAPTVAPIVPSAVESGASGTFAVTGSDPNVPASLPLTFHVTQTTGPVLTSLTVASSGPSAGNVSFTAPTGVLTPTDVTIDVTATNTAGVASAASTATVTITPAAAVCVAPVASTGGPYTVNSGSTVTLAGSATGSTPLTFAWTASAGTFSDATLANPVFTAPAVTVDTPVNISLAATNSCLGGSTNTATSTITVKASLPPTVAHVNPVSVFTGNNGTFTLSGSDPNTPAKLPLHFIVTQAGAPALLNLLTTDNPPTGATVTFRAPSLPVNQVLPTVINLTITATNSLGQVSAPEFTTVTVKQNPDVVNITNAEYRTGQQRLVMTATSSVISPDLILTLQPYVTSTGTTFTPTPLIVFTNAGNGLYNLTAVGVPQPAAGASLTVKSNLNGISPAHALDRLRK
jgi:hypothetical protein